MSQPLPSVTVGIPFFNCAPFLADALRSVFAQTHQNWELLLIDDGSTDASLEIAQSIDDPRVRVISDGVNRGLAARLNQIAFEAKHDLIARMDGDDLLHPLRLEMQLRQLVHHPNADLVGSGTYSVTRDCVLQGKRSLNVQYPLLNEVLAGRSGIIHASSVYRKEWILRHPYDPSVRRSEDYELFVRAASAGDLKSITIADPLYIYREDLNISRQKLLSSYRWEQKVIRRHARPTSLMVKHLVRIGLKAAIVGLAFGPPMQRWMQKRRNPEPLTPVDRAHFDAALALVQQTNLPIRP